jgi:hypothetical protein
MTLDFKMQIVKSVLDMLPQPENVLTGKDIQKVIADSLGSEKLSVDAVDTSHSHQVALLILSDNRVKGQDFFLQNYLKNNGNLRIGHESVDEGALIMLSDDNYYLITPENSPLKTMRVPTEAGQKKVICISCASPLIKAALKRKAGQHFCFNNQQKRIVEIC